MEKNPAKNILDPEQRLSFPGLNETSIDNGDLLHTYQERVQLFAQVLEYSSQPFSLVTPEGKILDCNPAFLDMIGYSKEELSNISWDKDLTPTEWFDAQSHYLGELQRSGVPVRT